MYHLLVKFNGWHQNRDSIGCDRVFEYTQDAIVKTYKPGGVFDQTKITQIPALFASETHGDGSQFARAGYIDSVENAGKEVHIGYHFETEVSPIPNAILQHLSSEFGVGGQEFSRTHWAIKDIDLFRVLLENQVTARISPGCFHLTSLPS